MQEVKQKLPIQGRENVTAQSAPILSGKTLLRRRLRSEASPLGRRHSGGLETATTIESRHQVWTLVVTEKRYSSVRTRRGNREQGTGIVGAARSDEPVGTENMAKFSSSLGVSPANPTLSEDSEL